MPVKPAAIKSGQESSRKVSKRRAPVLLVEQDRRFGSPGTGVVRGNGGTQIFPLCAALACQSPAQASRWLPRDPAGACAAGPPRAASSGAMTRNGKTASAPAGRWLDADQLTAR